MTLNYNTFVLYFDYQCLTDHQYDICNTYEFHTVGNLTKGFIPIDNFTSFLSNFNDTSIINECLVNIDYEMIIPIAEIECNFEQTNTIYYNQTLKPDAWHLDLMDSVKDTKYNFINHTGDVELWILDTGVNWKHEEFYKDQVVDVDPSFNINNLSHPHGTGTASAAGGKNYGTSKKFTIYNYPVCRFGGSCGSGDVDNGLKFIANYLVNNTGKRIVINLSIGSSIGYNPINSTIGIYYNDFFRDLEQKGAIIVTSAGNSNQDACNWLYSFSPYVISVGSLDANFNKSAFSNFGDCVDIWSFGSNVPLAYSTTVNNVVQFKSGTSFSSPLVAGIVANLLEANRSLTRQDVLNIMYSKQKQFVTARYLCGDSKIRCCRGRIPSSRLDVSCKKQSITNCQRTCYVGYC